MAKIKTAFREFYQKLLTLYPEREAGHIAHLVFERVTGLTRLDLVTRPDHVLSPLQQEHIDAKLGQLLTHKPVQYILNESYFYHLPFYVDENVLIPRPETEELVEWIIQVSNPEKAPVILDAGTGSGCIPVALKKHLPNARVLALDKSAGALRVAQKNADRHHVDISFIQADLLQKEWFAELPSLDIIVSNPPYIPQSEKGNMSKNVIDFEPEQALFVPDNDPLIFYKALVACAKEKLDPDGNLFLEIHEDLGKGVSALLRDADFNVELKKDMSSRDRMIRAGFSRR